MKNLNNSVFDNYDLKGLLTMTAAEAVTIDGGTYSWDQFCSDCSSAWSDFKAGFSSGFKSGAAAADNS